MKKITLLFLLIGFVASAQMKYRGIGVFGSLTQSAHRYVNLDTDKKATDSLYKYYYAQSHISKEFFNWGAGLFLELGGSKARWQTEVEYANKGAKEMGLTNAYTGDRTGSYETNKYTYIQWNNYYKGYYAAGLAHWYFLLGARLEYLFKSAAPVFPGFSDAFPKFWFSGDVALGFEMPIAKKFHAFIEYHYNPDVLRHTHDNVKIGNRTLELRAGIVMRPRKRSIDDCNAPVYRGPNY